MISSKFADFEHDSSILKLHSLCWIDIIFAGVPKSKTTFVNVCQIHFVTELVVLSNVRSARQEDRTLTMYTRILKRSTRLSTITPSPTPFLRISYGNLGCSTISVEHQRKTAMKILKIRRTQKIRCSREKTVHSTKQWLICSWSMLEDEKESQACFWTDSREAGCVMMNRTNITFRNTGTY